MNHWKEKLTAAYFNHRNAESESRKKRNLFKVLESVSQSAINDASNFEFNELQNWTNFILPKHLPCFFTILKVKAKSDLEKLLYLFMSSDDEKTLKDEIKHVSASLLSRFLEHLIKTAPCFPGRREKIKIVIKERPDVLLEMNQFLLIDMSLVIDRTHYIYFENIQLLLDKVKSVECFQNFSNKLNHCPSLRKSFEGDKTVVKAWDNLSNYEFTKAENFKAMVDVYSKASFNWQNDLNVFKIILNAMDGENLIYFLEQIKRNHRENGFSYSAAVVAAKRIIKKQIKSSVSFSTIYDKAVLLDYPVSKLRKQIIKEYLDS